MHQFDTPGMILLGVLTGLVFGFLLHKGGVTRYEVIVRQFLLRDFTVLKVMLTAIVVGAAGIFGMRALGMDVSLHVKGAALAANVIGGLIFGVGMALLGFCPGTGIAALGDGSRHAWPGALGMLAGGAGFAYLYPFIKDGILKAGTVSVGAGDDATNKITFADLLGISPWWFVLAVAVIAVVLFILLERRRPSLEVMA